MQLKSAQHAGSQRGLGLIMEPTVQVTGVPHNTGLGQAGGDGGEAGEEGCKAAVKRCNEGRKAPLQPHPRRCVPVAHLHHDRCNAGKELAVEGTA